MRIGQLDQNKIVVSIIAVTVGKDGEKIRKTHQSVDVYDATPEEVASAVARGLRAAEGAGKK